MHTAEARRDQPERPLDPRPRLGSHAGLPSGDDASAAAATAGAQSSLWVEPSEGRALATLLRPRLLQSRAAVRALLREALLMEAALGSTHDLHASSLCALLPRLWADFIRNGDMDQMR